MRRVLLLVLAGLLLSACGVSTDAGVRKLGPEEVPFTFMPAQPAPPTPVNGERTTIYLVRAEDRTLRSVTRTLPADPTPQVLLEALQRGPDDQESRAGLTTAVSEDVALVPSEDTARRVVTVQVPESRNADENLGLGQIVLTLTRLSEVAAVQFVRDGAPIQVPGPKGELIRGPFNRSAYAGLLVPG